MNNDRALTLFEKLQMHLFNDENDLPPERIFTKQELVIRERYMNVFTFWLDKPTLSDKKIIQYMITNLGISKRQAYYDVDKIKVLLGNVRNATKEWQRYKLISMLDRAYELAEVKKMPIAMIMAADKLGKYTNLDKEDALHIPYDEIVPQSFEPTGDVSVLGIQPIPDLKERQRQMREKYGSTMIEETSYEMLEEDGNPGD
jgi:hypothetical protein